MKALTDFSQQMRIQMSSHYWHFPVWCLYSFRLQRLSARESGFMFTVQTLKDVILRVFLSQSKFGLGSVIDFSNTGVRAPDSAEHIPA